MCAPGVCRCRCAAGDTAILNGPGAAWTEPTALADENFSDHFSALAGEYARGRPSYPPALYEWIAGASPARERVWDCATGNGQAAVGLAGFFDEVCATDASSEQVANGQAGANIRYSVELAESTTFPAAHFDAVTVAQAMHWFRIDDFGREVARVLRPGGVLVAWTYGFFHIEPAIDALIEREFFKPVESYWPDGAEVAWSGYRDVELPLAPVRTPVLPMICDWALPELAAYLRSWSALRYYGEQHGEGLLERALQHLVPLWGNPAQRRAVSMDFAIRAWRNTSPLI